MTDLRRKGDRALWWSSATSEERTEVTRIDKRIRALADERQKLTQRRYAITNRCTVRTLARREKVNG